VWEFEEEPAEKDELILDALHPLYLNIFFDSAIFYFPCEYSSPNVSTSYHSPNTSDVSISLHCREDTYFYANPLNLSFFVPKNEEGGHSCFSSTPLYDSSDHEDVDEHLEFFYHGCHDLFISSFDHDVDSHTIDPSKPQVFDDLPTNEVETPQVVEAL